MAAFEGSKHLMKTIAISPHMDSSMGSGCNILIETATLVLPTCVFSSAFDFLPTIY
jgi:hypothetical protein